MPATATAEQLARNGQLAAVLRAAMKHRGWNVSQLNEAMGKKPHFTPTYTWIAGTGTPTAKSRASLAKALELNVEQLKPRPVTLPVAKSAALIPTPNIAPAVAAKPAHDVLTFNVTSNGDCRLRMDVVLPREQGSALLRMILDAGVVFGEAAS